ncbi:MAG: O-antigen ligase family protein [Myxococcales bacterium]
MVRALAFFLFIALTAENFAEFPFANRWSTFMRPIGDILHKRLPIGVTGLHFLVFVWCLVLMVRRRGQTARVRALDRALWLNLGTMAFMVIYGSLNGGRFMFALLQVNTFIFLPITAFLFLHGARTPTDFRLLGKTIVAAALFRGVLAVYFRYVIVPVEFETVPATLTTHADTMLFATATIIAISSGIEQRKRSVVIPAALLTAFLLFVILINGRRLGFVSVAGSCLVLYAILRRDLRRRINKWLIVLAPLLLVYAAVGWNSTHTIFKPVHSFATILGSHEDASSQTRNIENYNLIITLSKNKLLGRGWGHEYDEVSVAYSVAEAFSVYRYIPHNMVLGIWAFLGVVGSTGVWLVFVVGAFLGARAYHYSRTPLERVISAVALCEFVIYGQQAYGDMGVIAWNGNMLAGVALAAASRMAVHTRAMAPPNSQAPGARGAKPTSSGRLGSAAA